MFFSFCPYFRQPWSWLSFLLSLYVHLSVRPATHRPVPPSFHGKWWMIPPERRRHNGLRQTLTLAGVWIQMAALNRMWSQSCFSSGAPCVRPSRYLAKERNCSSTAPVTCTREDWWGRRHTVQQWRDRGKRKKRVFFSRLSFSRPLSHWWHLNLKWCFLVTLLCRK